LSAARVRESVAILKNSAGPMLAARSTNAAKCLSAESLNRMNRL
jgi:hypothetical protein